MVTLTTLVALVRVTVEKAREEETVPLTGTGLEELNDSPVALLSIALTVSDGEEAAIPVDGLNPLTERIIPSATTRVIRTTLVLCISSLLS
jgi:hypothetical protein